MVMPRMYVENPPATPLPFGLLSAATVLDDDSPHWQAGVEYEPEACGTAFTRGPGCAPAPDFGTFAVSVADTGIATLDVTGAPGDTYTIDWGDGTVVEDATPDAATHTYGDAGTYRVTMTGAFIDGYSATAVVTVEDGEESGPFDGDVQQIKPPTDGFPLDGADGFTVVHLLSCRLLGGGEARGRERAAAGLRAGESRAVEEAFAAQIALRDGAVDLTPAPGDAVDVVTGLALLEGWAAANYGGVPVVHVPRTVGSILGTEGAVVRAGTSLQTVQGALVASGGGYEGMNGPPTDAEDPSTVQAPGDGEAWMYVTGPVTARRAAVIETGVVAGMFPVDNGFVALAERPYVVGTECITAAVLVTVAPVPA